MENIVDTLNKLPMPKHAYGHVEVSQINTAETKLNLRFANDYREFVQYLGALVYKNNELCGIVPYPSLDVVNRTIHARETDAAFPQSMYVISEIHIDGILILQNQKGEIFQYLPLQYTKKIFNSLSDFILSL